MEDLQSSLILRGLKRIDPGSGEEVREWGSVEVPAILVASNPKDKRKWFSRVRLRAFVRDRKWVVLDDATDRPLAMAPRHGQGLNEAIGKALRLLELEAEAQKRADPAAFYAVQFEVQGGGAVLHKFPSRWLRDLWVSEADRRGVKRAAVKAPKEAKGVVFFDRLPGVPTVLESWEDWGGRNMEEALAAASRYWHQRADRR